MHLAGFVFAIIALIIAFAIWTRAQTLRRAEFIRTYAWPPQLLDKLEKKHKNFTRKETSLVSKGLRQYFMVYLKGGLKPVSMPSQVADDLWHEFILYTRDYDAFCKRAFGAFFHHTPAVMLSPERRSGNAGLRRVWWYACKDENINPSNPSRLPLIFALDGKLDIQNGYRYVADCMGLRRTGDTTTQCAGDFTSSSIDGSTDGIGDSGGGDGGGGDGGGDGGGCGGGGD
jgi:hypothetical protein